MSMKNLLMPAGIACIILGKLAFNELVKDSNAVAWDRAVKVTTKHRSDDDINVLKSVDEAVKKSDAVFDKEQDIFNKQIDDWMEASGWNSRKKTITDIRDQEVKAITEDFGFDKKRNDIIEASNKQIAEYRNSLNYDERVSSLKNDIETAKSNYEMQKTTLKLAAGDNGTYDELKKTAKRVKNTAVENAERDIKTLTSRLEAQTKVINDERDRKISELNRALNERKNGVVKRYDDQLTSLNQELANRSESIRNDIVSARSKEDMEIVNNAKDLLARKEDIYDAEKMVIDQAYREMSTAEKFGYYFSSKKWPRIGVIGLACVPMIPVAIVLQKYWIFIKNVLDAMVAYKAV